MKSGTVLPFFCRISVASTSESVFLCNFKDHKDGFFDALLAIHLTAAMMYRWFVTKRDFPDDARGRDARVGYALPTPRRGNQELLAQPKHLLE